MKDHKQVDVAAYRAAIPELGAVDLVCAAGEFAGLRFSLDLPSGWRTTIPRPAFRSVTEFPEEDIVLTCDLGTVTLLNPMVTALDNSGNLSGVSIAVHLFTSELPPETQCTFRTYVRVKSDISGHMIFPAAYEDPTSGWTSRALLPINVDGLDADFLVLRGQPPTVVIEGHGQLVAHPEFLRITSGIRRLFSFLTGRMCDGDTVDMVFLKETGGALMRASWYEGRASDNTIYQPIPTDPRYPFQAAPFSTCLKSLLDEPELIYPLEYLIAFANLPIEMRGVVLSVALESLTSHLLSKGLVPRGGLLSEETWPGVRADLKSTLAAAAITKTERDIVASGQRGSHFHQNHRGPGTHPVARRRIFALPVGARVA